MGERGRKSYGAMNIMKALLELCTDGSKFVQSPVEALRIKTGLRTTITLQNYLKDLETEGFISLVWTPRGGQIEYLKIINVPTENTPNELPSTTSRKEPATPLVDKATSKTRNQQDIPTVILVDYDNVVISAARNNFSISFLRLKEFLRKFGRIKFSFVFMPINSSKPEVNQMLWEAGFPVIVCPMKNKDKDSVDEKLKWQARQFLSETSIEHVVVISKDNDFKDLEDFARDLHKELTFVNVEVEKEHIHGVDEVSELEYGKDVERYTFLIRCIASGITGASPRDAEAIKFTKALIYAIYLEIGLEKTRCISFKTLQEAAWRHISNPWARLVAPGEPRWVMTAMNREDMLIQNHGTKTTYYTLPENNPVIQKIVKERKALERAS